MKMNMIRLIGAASVDLPILGADPSGPFVLKSAEGLGPPEINVRLAKTVLEKALYHAKRAYEGGFPLDGLKRRLKEAGAWKE